MENHSANRAEAVKNLARAHGFALAGLAAVPADGAAPRALALDAWLKNGHAGPLDYVKENAATRMNLRERYPWVRGILCVAAFYDARAQGERGRDLAAHVARYARGRDYHLVFTRRLKALGKALEAAGLSTRAHYYVDTGPVLERAWSERAGLGWIGKNTCLIHPRLGSFMLLGELLLDADLEPDPPQTHHCGTCTRCLDACPTQALPAPGVLDANRCIVTWNLEQKGLVPEDRWAEFHGWAGGCDICQAVCPFNAPERAPAPDEELARPLPWQALTLAQAIGMDEAEFDRCFQASALRRTGWKGIRLGAITAAGNVKAASARAALEACLNDRD
ncbi:MAG: tRNA epoxyqueuosine(34) reductase QueG, partial [Planctomycetota bacterium]|nr:tRNA epoxyqueuosine(34) reductase QueG [Planctomycetota bacterium]